MRRDVDVEELDRAGQAGKQGREKYDDDNNVMMIYVCTVPHLPYSRTPVRVGLI